jgi:hypothetical protein
MYRERKGNMQRRFERRLWTLILTLLLLGGGSVSLPTAVRADFAPGETGNPPAPDAGDPDFPQGPKGGMTKVGPPRGVNSPTGETYVSRTGRMVLWMKWTFRVAYASTWRIFFRY